MYDNFQKIKPSLNSLLKQMVLLNVKIKIDISDWNNFKKRSKMRLGFQTEGT